jgi:hypothetical protein
MCAIAVRIGAIGQKTGVTAAKIGGTLATMAGAAIGGKTSVTAAKIAVIVAKTYVIGGRTGAIAAGELRLRWTAALKGCATWPEYRFDV